MPDGSIVDWDYETVTKVAKLLTVDKNGKDATDPAFDPEAIVQWGFEPQRDDIRQTGAYWKAGAFDSGDGKTVAIPDAWAAAWKYFYASMWTDHISMTGPQFLSTDINPDGYPFFTGNVAMSENYLWSTYGLADPPQDDWDMAATPSYDGQTTAALNADTFRILKSSKHPDEAFTVLTYLLGAASKQLLTAYGGMPARVADQDAFFTDSQANYTQTIDWQVAKDGIAYGDVPNFEGYMPAYNESLDLLITFGTKWQATPGLDLDTEIQALKTQMQAIWDKAG
jgi:multiple sugar transport system substrate-binding protein